VPAILIARYPHPPTPRPACRSKPTRLVGQARSPQLVVRRVDATQLRDVLRTAVHSASVRDQIGAVENGNPRSSFRMSTVRRMM